MPRPPRFIHPLRLVRGETNARSQPKFAALIGVSGSTIQAIENGKLALSWKLAQRIERATGADARELMHGSDGRALTVFGDAYTREFFDQWTHRQEEVKEDHELADAMAGDIAYWVDVLFRAAAHRKEQKLHLVQHALAEALQVICEEHGLREGVNRIMGGGRTVDVKCQSVAEWRQEAPGIQSRFGFHDSPIFDADTRLMLAAEILPIWSPGSPRPAKVRRPSSLKVRPG